MKKFNVDVDVTFSLLLEVEAEDQYEAAAAAEDMAEHADLSGKFFDVSAWNTEEINDES